MTALTKGIGLSGINRSGWGATFVVFFVVIALFFIPEIVGFKKSSVSTYDPNYEAPVAPEVEPAAIESVANTSLDLNSERTSLEPQRGSPLDQIISAFDSINPFKSKASDSGTQLKEAGQDVVSPDVDAKYVSDNKDAERKRAKLELSETHLTWEKIRAPATKNALVSAQKEAINIAKSMPGTKKETRYALYNFANGVTSVLQGEGIFESPEEAVSYLENLDVSVTRAMFREEIDRTDYMRWGAVSFGAELQHSKLTRTHNLYKMPFNPRLTLTNVAVQQDASRRGHWDESGNSYVKFSAYVVGKDISKVSLLRNGKVVVRGFSLSPAEEKTNRRYFELRQGVGRGVYVVRVEDKFGSKFEKSYVFYEPARKFTWNKGDGHFEIPFKSEDGYVDPRVDRYFRFSGGGLGRASNQGFSVF